ncbi:hypothetical protein N658DRAFT_437247, partial [Parathielavia hyrcaniae]
RQYVTRRNGEEWDPTCIVEKHQRKGGWMFWGCFSGLGKGPGLFWEKDWGKINAETYRTRTVPVIHGWIQMYLNPIESCWNWMKDWIEDRYGLEEKPSYDKLREYVKEAWEALPDDNLKQLLASMPERCKAVIAANGMHTKY